MSVFEPNREPRKEHSTNPASGERQEPRGETEQDGNICSLGAQPAKHGKNNSAKTADELLAAECRLARKRETLRYGGELHHYHKPYFLTLHRTASAREW